MIFDKALAVFAYPLGIALVGLVLAWIALLWHWRKTGLVLVFACVLGLWITSTPLFARWALATLEWRYPAEALASYKPADVIILLGGALSPGEPYPDLGEAGDRVLHTYRLYKAGLAPRILTSGGNVFPDRGISEAQATADLLVSFGVDRSAILIEGVSRNTYENARETAQIWQREAFVSGLLVTSSLHMPRALAAFKKAGLDVIPAPIDKRSMRMVPPFPVSVLPDSEYLNATRDVLKEWVGVLVYRWRGWI